MGYLILGGLMTITLALLPFAFRIAQHLDVSSLGSVSPAEIVEVAVGPLDAKAHAFFFITTVQRVCLTGLFFFMMCVAERTYKQVRGHVSCSCIRESPTSILITPDLVLKIVTFGGFLPCQILF